ncbi:unnamed protein product [Oncorhynchus mykiss]|uniref:Uncharacterized protein n=1 Tax=Oncorhynchus mykiss TaxID=8022 RepID=A0A060YB51_ONCMY|nr:unnamed protein product [Oncorhynchus mykiss]
MLNTFPHLELIKVILIHPSPDYLSASVSSPGILSTASDPELEDSDGGVNGDSPKTPPSRPQRKEKKDYPVRLFIYVIVFAM